MQLAIVHYHLNRGGVTRVIENQLRGLAELDQSAWPDRAVIFYGGRADGWDQSVIDDSPFPIAKTVVPELEYDQPQNDRAGDRSQPSLAAALKTAGWRSADTVVHFHNHSLGKSAALLDMLHELGRDGWPLLLQVHDFAEDLRPDNYRSLVENAGSLAQLQAQLYPQGDHVHYAVLTDHDRQVLQTAGVAAARLHVLPNAVTIHQPADHQAARQHLQTSCDVPVDRPYVIYPVRAIRRKNIGELLLWSAVVQQAAWAVTLAPLNPREQAAYQAWVQLAGELDLPVLFDVGGAGGMSLAENYAAADAAITTSVAEGFGLVFLEASLADRPLFGRDLPGVTADFRRAGMTFPGLDATLWIPAEWVVRGQLARTYVQLTRQLRTSYHLPPIADEQVAGQLDWMLAAEALDFARLDAAAQSEVVRRVATNPTAREQLQTLNPRLQAMEQYFDGERRESWQRNGHENREVIATNYSLPVIATQYAELLGQLLASSHNQWSAEQSVGQSVLQQFTRPDRLYPIRL